MAPKNRPAWYQPRSALDHAGDLADARAGRTKYLAYLAWLSEDEPTRKAQHFAEMSQGWIIGTTDFAKTILKEHQALVGHGRRMAAAMKARTAATNRWLGAALNMGGLHDVSREISAWRRRCEPARQQKPERTTNCKA